MQIYTLLLCTFVATTQEQRLATNLIQQLPPIVSRSFSIFSTPIGQQFLQGLQGYSSTHQQDHVTESQLQDVYTSNQQNYGSQSVFDNESPQHNFVGEQQQFKDPSKRSEFNEQRDESQIQSMVGGGSQQYGVGTSLHSAIDELQQSNERPSQQTDLNGPLLLPFNDEEFKTYQQQGFNKPPPPQQQTDIQNTNQLEQDLLQNLDQQSGLGEDQQTQAYTGSLQGSNQGTVYSFERKNNQEKNLSVENIQNDHKDKSKEQQVAAEHHNSLTNQQSDGGNKNESNEGPDVQSGEKEGDIDENEEGSEEESEEESEEDSEEIKEDSEEDSDESEEDSEEDSEEESEEDSEEESEEDSDESEEDSEESEEDTDETEEHLEKSGEHKEETETRRENN